MFHPMTTGDNATLDSNVSTSKTSFKNVFVSINSLFSSKSVEVNGKEIQVNVRMGGDYKFLLMVLEMAGATSNYAFIYCKIHTDDRRDMSKAHDFYCQENLARTIEEMSQNALNNYHGCRLKPHFRIILSPVDVDQLHMMLRITDILLINLIEDATDYDAKEKNGIIPKPNVSHID